MAMTRGEFLNQVGRLSARWGPKNYCDEIKERIWECAKDLSLADMTRIVDDMLDSFRVAPLPKDFREASRRRMDFSKFFENVGKGREFNKAWKPNCAWCRDTGTVYAFDTQGHICADGKGYKYAFACPCQKGSSMPNTLPRRGDSLAARFELDVPVDATPNKK